MGRTLPWKQGGATTAPKSAPETLGPSSPFGSRDQARRAPHTPQHDHDQPAPISSPPKPVAESLMISGLGNDDRWRMVEDEFVAVAHKFTAHLHAAEYQRRKKQARDQDVDAIRALSRPVVGPMTDHVKRDKAVLSLRRSQNATVKKARARTKAPYTPDDDDHDADDLPWAGSNLEGLMDSPRKKRVPLSTVVPTPTDTRAAALERKKNSVAKTSQPSNASRPADLSRQRSGRAQSKDRGDGETGEMLPTLRREGLVIGAVSSAVPRRDSGPSVPTALATSTLPGDESDSSVDLLFDFGTRLKRGASHR